MLDRRRLILASAAATLQGALGFESPSLAAPGAPAEAKAGEIKTAGVKRVPVARGKYTVWTKTLGKGTPVLTLHGGPGATHEYLECFEDFLPQAGFSLVFYDQLGSHYSDQPEDESLWTVARFRDEVEEVRKGLGLDRFYLYGSSWGGMLAIEYALAHPERLKGLVISDMTASVPSYMTYAAKLRAALPADVIATLDKYEAKGDYHAPDYGKAMFEQVYARHLCRLDPWPDAVQRTFKHFNEKVYNVMQGPNEFVITGNWADLPKIKVPTLVMCGAKGTMNPDDIRREGSLIPSSRARVIPNGSHMGMWDDQAAYMEALVGFLKDVEGGRFRTDGKK